MLQYKCVDWFIFTSMHSLWWLTVSKMVAITKPFQQILAGRRCSVIITGIWVSGAVTATALSPRMAICNLNTCMSGNCPARVTNSLVSTVMYSANIATCSRSCSFSWENIDVHAALMPFDIWKPWKVHASSVGSIPHKTGYDMTSAFNGKGARSDG